MRDATRNVEEIVMSSDPSELLPFLRDAAAVYLDQGRSVTDRAQALSEILKAYWPNRSPEVIAEFRGVALLLVLIGAYRNSHQRNAVVAVLMDALTSMIREIARQVSWGNMQADFVDESVNLVLGPRKLGGPRIFEYDPARETLRAWLRKILGRLFIDKIRGQVEPQHVQLPEDIIDPRLPVDTTPWLWEEVYRCLSGIPPAILLPGLVSTKLWWELPAEMQAGCLARYNALPNIKRLSPSFPEGVLDIRSSSKDNRQALAEAFGCSLPTLGTRVFRFRQTLRRLRE
jgi:hypothetical protein